MSSIFSLLNDVADEKENIHVPPKIEKLPPISTMVSPDFYYQPAPMDLWRSRNMQMQYQPAQDHIFVKSEIPTNIHGEDLSKFYSKTARRKFYADIEKAAKKKERERKKALKEEKRRIKLEKRLAKEREKQMKKEARAKRSVRPTRQAKTAAMSVVSSVNDDESNSETEYESLAGSEPEENEVSADEQDEIEVEEEVVIKSKRIKLRDVKEVKKEVLNAEIESEEEEILTPEQKTTLNELDKLEKMLKSLPLDHPDILELYQSLIPQTQVDIAKSYKQLDDTRTESINIAKLKLKNNMEKIGRDCECEMKSIQCDFDFVTKNVKLFLNECCDEVCESFLEEIEMVTDCCY